MPVGGFEHTERGHGRIVLQHVQVIENTDAPAGYKMAQGTPPGTSASQEAGWDDDERMRVLGITPL